MPIMPPFLRKKIFDKGAKGPAPAAPAAGAPIEGEEGVDDGSSSSSSDIDAPQVAGGKPNPLKAWAAARSSKV